MLGKQSKSNTSKESIIFNWNEKDFESQLRTCEKDDEVQIALQFLNDKNLQILEAGCGQGRVVKYLYDLGFKDVHGIEINRKAVEFLNKRFPELNVIHGSILQMPYHKESFDIVLSYGVIEHFPDGPHVPMKSMYDILKPGGIVVVTVPILNKIRKIKNFLSHFDVRQKDIIRKIFGKNPIIKNINKFSYYVFPQIGNFHEYRFTQKQFENICINSNFKIIKSISIAHEDGVYHCFGPRFIKFENSEWKMNKIVSFINNLFKKIPNFHNHMHMCVLQK